MGAKIYSITLGLGSCHIIQDQGVIAIDTGNPKKGKEFLKGLEEASIKPEEVNLIVLTHGHFDHIGSTAEIKELTGAKVAMHQNEQAWLEKGLKPMPPGVTRWGKFLSGFITAVMIPFVHIPPTEVDLVLSDEGLSLTEYGVAGKIMYTPGHSSGSVSVLLDSGEAFVGDLAMNKLPMRRGPGLPVFAEDWAKVQESWKMLLEQGIQTVYPAHGEPFSIDIIKDALS
jgi:glyoxylase-like metal-dependent hydrolase (beta-lactamase superfamily II)